MPDIPAERLEIECAHRALTKQWDKGPPRDIIVKLLYFQTKERHMAAVRDRGHGLRFQGHDYQLYTDLASSTIQKRKAMKPFLAILQHHKVEYRWGFPFAVLFMINNRRYSIKTPEEMDRCLRQLHLSISKKQGDSPDPRHLRSQKRDRTPSP